MRKQLLMSVLLIISFLGCTQEYHINSLIEKLATENTTISQAAGDELVSIGLPTVKPLISVLANKDSVVRYRASETLARIGLPSINPLILALSDNDTSQAAAESLVKIGSPAVTPLIAQMGDPNADVRYLAVEILGKIKDERSVEPLIQQLKDDSAPVQTAVSKALVSIGPGATEQLLNSIKDPDADFRLSIINILGDTGDLRGIPVLIDSLADNNEMINRAAMVSLVKIGSPAVDPLISTIEKAKINMRCRIYYVLGEIKDARSVQPLITGLNDNNDKVQLAAATALVAIGSPAVDPLVDALKCYYAKERVGVTASIYNKKSCQFFPSDTAKNQIMWIFGELKDARSVPVLIYALDLDLDRSERALEKIGEPALEPLISLIQQMDYTTTNYISFTALTDRILDNTNIKGTNIENILMDAIKQKNIHIVRALYEYYISHGLPSSEPVLVEALLSTDFLYGRWMALAYLNCGNEQLEQAGSVWAAWHGYNVTTKTFRPGEFDWEYSGLKWESR